MGNTLTYVFIHFPLISPCIDFKGLYFLHNVQIRVHCTEDKDGQVCSVSHTSTFNHRKRVCDKVFASFTQLFSLISGHLKNSGFYSGLHLLTSACLHTKRRKQYINKCFGLLLIFMSVFLNLKVIMEVALQMLVLHLEGNWKLVNWS